MKLKRIALWLCQAKGGTPGFCLENYGTVIFIWGNILVHMEAVGNIDEHSIGGVGAGIEPSGLGTSESRAKNSSLSRIPNSERERVLAAELSPITATSNAMASGTFNSIFRLCVARIKNTVNVCILILENY